MKTHIQLIQSRGLNCWKALMAGVVSLSLVHAARADVTSGTSGSYGLRGNVEVELLAAPILTTTVGAGTLTGAAPNPYNTTQSGVSLGTNIGVSVSAALSVDAVQSTGVFNGNVFSNVDGGAGIRTTSATTGIANLGLNVGDVQLLILDPPAALSLTATAINTSSTIMGDYGAFTSAGTSQITGFGLALNGGAVVNLTSLLGGAGFTLGTDFLADGTLLTSNMSVDLNALGLAGASLVFNRQVTSGNGISSLGLETTAIYLDLDAGLGSSVNLDTDIAIGQSTAAQGGVSVVPEPGSAILFALGIVTLLGHRRRLP